MKHFLTAIILLASTITFAQNLGSISGALLDIESNGQPLKFAKVSIKEIGKEILSDEQGNFTFQNLKEGNYTLICEFIGYETQELKVNVSLKQEASPITLSLKASTVSLDDIMMTLASADSNLKDPISQ